MDMFDLTATIKLDSSEFNAGVDQAAQKANGLSVATGNLDRGMKTLTRLTAAGGVALAAFGATSVRTGMKFDSSMSQVAATMGVTVDEIQDLRQYAMQMGKTTAFSATEAADALNYMALAGYDAQTSMEMLPNVLNLAAAGGIDLAYASDMITDSQSALGLTLEDTNVLVDQMAMAASKSNTSVSQLGEAILTVGGTARNLSGGTNELATALGILADNGIKGSEGGTALRNVILSLSAPTDQAAQKMQELGLQVFDAEGNMRPLNDVFTDLNNILGTMSQEDRMNVLNELFNKVDLKSANALLANSGERWNELSGYIDDAAGAAEKMANTQLDNLQGDVTLLKSAFEGLQIEVSDKLTPALRVGVQGLTTLIEHAGQIAGAMSPAVGAFATFAGIVITVSRVIPALKLAVSDLWKVIAANPIALAIGLMAGLAVGAYRLATHFGELYTEADKAAEGIRNLNRATESSVSDFAEADKAAGHAVENIKGKLGEVATETVARMGEGGSEGAIAYRNNMMTELASIDPEMAAIVAQAMDSNAALVASYGGQYGAAGVDDGSQYATGFGDGASQMEGTISTVAETEMSAATAAAEGGAAQASVAGMEFGNNLATGMQAGAAQMVTAAASSVQRAIAAARGATGGASGVGAQIGAGIAGGIMAAAGRIASAAASVVRTAISAAKAAAAIASPSKKFRDEVGLFMGLGVAEGLEDSEDKVVQAAVKLARDTYSKAQEWLRRNAKFNDWTLQEQLEVWQEIQSGFIEGSEQYLDAEEKIFDLRRDIEEEYYDDAKRRIQKDTKFRKLSLKEQLKMWVELQQQYEKGTEQYEEIEEKTFDLRADIQDGFREKVQDIWDKIADAQQNYADKLASRKEEIMSSYGLFDDVQDRYRLNSQDILDNLTRQVNVMTSFYDELEELAARGASEQMVDEIRKMGPQAVDQLDALLAMTDKQFEKYAELYGKKQELANNTALEELKQLGIDTGFEIQDQLDALKKLYAEESPVLGKTFVTEIANGIKSSMGAVVSAARELANQANQAFASTLNISSLSSSTKTTSFASSALGVSSAGIINSTAKNQTSESRYSFNLVLPNGDTLAKYTFEPLKNYAASKGQPIVNPT